MQQTTNTSRATRAGFATARRIGRILTWPLRRFFDPRFANVRDAQSVTLDLVRELHRMVEADSDASNEATALLGAELSDVRDLVEGVTGEVELRATEPAGKVSVDHLDERTAGFLNYAGSHRGFAAQSALWFNPAVVLRYAAQSVQVDTVNERIVEGPYALRALREVPQGARVLEVGCAESTLALSLACLGYHVTAVDPRGYPFAHPRLLVVSADVASTEVRGTFDAVVCISTMEHVGLEAYGQSRADGADLAAMRRMHALTRAGGLLVLTVPFGRAGVSTTERRYDHAALDALLEGWDVAELAFARQTGPTVWDVGDRLEGENIDAVALVTAHRG